MTTYLTRIQNNQITDSTINAATKIAPGSIQGNLLAATVTFNSNITILGNLTVANSYTQLNSINTYINDPIVVFNNGYTGTPSYDVGILVNRNLQSLPGYGSVNAAWVWKEADQAFEGIATTETGTTAGSINNSGYANVKIGNLTAVSGTINNFLTVGTTLGVTGAATFSSTTLTSGVATHTANLVAASGTASTNTTTGALVVVGGTGISGDVNIGGSLSVSGVTKYTGNLVAAATTTSTSTTTGSIVSLGGIGLAGNVTAGGQVQAGLGLYAVGAFNGGYSDGTVVDYVNNNGRISVGSGDALTFYAGGPAATQTLQISSAGVLTAAGNIVAASGTASSNTTTGALVVSGGAGISGAAYVGGVLNVAQAATLQSTLAVSSTAIVSGNIVAAATTASTNTTTGALVVQGGVGIAGAVYTGSTATINGNINNTAGGGLTTTQTTGYLFNETATTLNVGSSATTLNLGATSGTATLANPTLVGTQTTQNVYNTVATTVNAFGAATTLGIGATSGTATIGNPTLVGTQTTQNVYNTVATTVNAFGAATTLNIGNASGVTNLSGVLKSGGNVVAGSGTASTSTTTGALVVKGGIGVSGDTYIGGNLSVAGTLTYINTTQEIVTGVEVVAGNLVANSGTASSNTTTGALVVAGGAGISGALNVGGGFGVAGNIADNGGGLTTTQTTGYLFNENATTLNVGSAATALNLGATSGTATIGNPTIVGTQTTQNLYNTVATTLNFAGAATTLNIGNSSGTTTVAGITKHSGNLVAAATTTSTNTTTGSIVSLGGVGIAGNLNVGSSTSQHNLQGNLLIGASSVGPSAYIPLVINQNSVVPFASDATFQISSADSNNGVIVIDSFAGTSASAFKGRHARGSSSAPAAVQTNDVLGAFVGVGYGASAYAQPVINNAAGLIVAATETFTNTSNATKVNLNYIPTGSTSGAPGLTVDSTGNVVIQQITPSTSFQTGALVVKGGMGVAGAAFLNDKLDVLLTTTSRGNLVAAATTVSSSATTGALVVVGGAGIGGNLYVGNSVFAGQGALTAGQFLGNYSDGVVVDYVSPNGRISVGPSDNLIFYSGGPATTQTLSIGSTGVLTATGNIVGASGTTSTSSTTGAIVAVGGVGISGNLNVGGITTVTGNVFLSNAVTINSTRTAGQDFLVKGVNDQTLIWARPNATYDSVIIGNSATVSNAIVGAKLVINSSDSILFPVGSNAQRPSSVGGTDVAGMFRYSTNLNGPEYYNGSSWQGITSSFTIITDKQFTGDGSTLSYTIANATTASASIVSINGVLQIPTLAYSVTGNVVTFTEPPASTDIIDIRVLTTTQTINGIASTNGYQQFAVDNNGAYVYTGTSSTQPTTLWNPQGAEVNQNANIILATASTPGQIDSFFANTYSSAEYTITSTIQGTNIREIAKILVVSDGTSANTYRTVYGITSTSGNTMTTWTANVTGSSVTLYGTPANANQIYRIRKNYQAV